jgi:site-specific recombinase XerD
MSDELRFRRLAPYLRRFFSEHLPLHRGVSPNTVKAYRDAWSLLLRFGVEQQDLGEADRWRIHHVDRAFILDFLLYIEEQRKVCARTRNYRLAAIHAFFRFLVGVEPELDLHCRRILAVPFKRARRSVIGFLEADELQSVLHAVPRGQPNSRRDLALLVFAYNTGARVHEIAQAVESDIFRGRSAYVRILGKGNKEREVPLWEGTLRMLDAYRSHRTKGRDAMQDDYLFLSRLRRRMTRFHVGRIITKYIDAAAAQHPAMRKKRLHAHSMRHTTAVHLLQGGAELNTIKAWLGHASIESLQVYLDLDLKKKRDILQRLVTPALAEACLQDIPVEATPDIHLIDWLDRL